MFLFIGGFIGNAILSIFRTLHLKIGEDVFFELLGGKYKPAVEEDRTFLFLDLKASTTIAEKLGHTKYSFFIQDCFIDLNPAMTNAMASIYKYVGDEAILTWPTEIALKNSNCVNVFFNFRKQLKARHSYYMERYGLVPEFKAGINAGLVMVAEVGVVKREIEYHGDVLNTAARIQGQCNDKKAWLLVSEVIKNALPINHGFSINLKGEILLRGKSESVNIYEILEK
jgi:adenylate cyclase